EVYKFKHIVGSTLKSFAFVEDGSRSIDQLLIIFEAITKNLDRTWRSLNVPSSFTTLLVASKALLVDEV
ncbi:unnamed protein product, partial [Rotaria socialis]